MPAGRSSWPTTTCAWATPKAPWPNRPVTCPGPGPRSPGWSRPIPTSTTPPTAWPVSTLPASCRHPPPARLDPGRLVLCLLGLALLDPAEEARGVGLVAVEELEPLGVGGPVALLLLEAFAEGCLDVVELGA